MDPWAHVFVHLFLAAEYWRNLDSTGEFSSAFSVRAWRGTSWSARTRCPHSVYVLGVVLHGLRVRACILTLSKSALPNRVMCLCEHWSRVLICMFFFARVNPGLLFEAFGLVCFCLCYVHRVAGRAHAPLPTSGSPGPLCAMHVDFRAMVPLVSLSSFGQGHTRLRACHG